MENIFDYIKRNEGRMLDELFVFLRQRSISTQNDGVEKCASLLCEFMNKAGINTRIYETPRHPIVYGEVLTDPTLPTIMIYGHYDVQPPEPYELWLNDPFEPEIRDNKIFARGASDNKSQLFAHVKGCEAYLQTNNKLPINMKYLFEGEEEIGSPSLDPFVASHKDLLACDAVVMSDSHVHESGRPMLILGLKGMAFAEITLIGANRDVHSMKAPCVPNPLWRMVSLLSTLKGEDGFVRIDGFYDDMRDPLPEELEAVDKIPYDPQAFLDDLSIHKFVQGRKGDNYYYNLIFEPTCNLSGLFGGYTGEGSKTIVPNKVTAKIDMRLVPNQDPQDIFNKLKSHLQKHGFEDAIIWTDNMIRPSRTPITNPFVEVAYRAVERGWGEKPIVYPGIGGAGPNYVFTDTLGVPCVIIPFAGADQNNHAPNESMTLSGFFNGIRTSACLMDEMALSRKLRS